MKNFKSCIQLTYIIVFFSLLNSCETQTPQPRNNIIDLWPQLPGCNCGGYTTQRISYVGDADGIGIGLKDKEMWDLDTAGPLPIDYRQDNDPEFTDIYPATANGEIMYVHTFEPPLDTVRKAHFAIGILGIEDSSFSELDIKFYFEGVEIYDAFDNVNQVINVANKSYETYGYYQINLNTALLHHLQDGEVEVRWEIVKSDKNIVNDYFAIDYSVLVVDWTNYSVPTTNTTSNWIELGDRDKFGSGLDNLYNWYPDSAGTLPIDNSTEDDPPFTDIYPADIDGLIEFDYEFELDSSSITSARFYLYAWGIQDGDWQNTHYNDTDIKFFIDDIELEGAFDYTNQMIWTGIQYKQAPGQITLEVPQALLEFIKDGNVTIRIEIHQYGSSMQLDKFAIDYIVLNYYTL